MNIGQAFPSDWLKAADLQGQSHAVRMDVVRMEDVGDPKGDKPVLHFQGKSKGLVLNKTNASTIAAAYGDETQSWHGQPLELFPSETDYQGRRVACIRVRVPAQAPAQPTPQNDGQPLGPAYDGPPPDDEIRF